MRATLQMVKIVTDSLQGRDIESMQPILQEVNSLHVQASNLLEELDSLVKEKLQKPGKGSPESPKAAKMPWLRQQRNLDRLQRQIKSITQSLSTSLTVLNTFQLAALSQSETARISLSIQGVSVIGGNHSTTQIAGNVSSVQAQLEHVLQQITSSEVSSAQLRPEDRISEIEQEPRNSNEAGESEDANLALISREGIPNPSTESVVRIVTNVSTENCNRFCQCQCHVRSQYRTPNWARGVFGSFYFQTNASMWLKRRGCNYPLCKKSGRPSTQIAFYAPSWMLRAAFYINAVKDDLDGMGANIAFKTPRVVPQLHIAWSLVSAGQVDRLVELFTVGKASIYDVGEDGESLLHVNVSTPESGSCD